MFAIQDEIAGSTAASLKMKLQPAAQPRRSRDVAAYEHCLKGRYLLRKATPDALAQAKGYLDQAIALDPEFALAYVELGAYFYWLANYGIRPAHEVLPLALGAARKALQLNPELPEAHAIYALATTLADFDWELAGLHYRKALAVKTPPPLAREWYGFLYLFPLGRLSDAIAELERAQQDDPLNVQGLTLLAVVLGAAGRYEEAENKFRQALELDPDFWLALFVRGVLHATRNELPTALDYARRASASAPGNPASIGLLAGVHSRLGNTPEATRLLEQLGPSEAYGAPTGLLCYHVARLEFEQAAHWAGMMIAQRDPNCLPGAANNRNFFEQAGLWKNLARQLKLPQSTPA